MALIGKNVVAPSLLVAIFTAQAMPATASVIGWGRVNMEGAIVNAACAIESASRDQTIDMKTLPVEQITRDGHGLTRSFTLKLVNCGLSGDNSANSGRQHFRMIFDGNAEGKNFGVIGDARGVALRIADSIGTDIYPGVPMSIENTLTKDYRLNYSMQLVANSQVLRAGDYRSAIRFKLDYY
ncbi:MULTISPECIES: fimbrial protein [Serratia]|jgi:type 1 fimbria pilin|uniref:fimbrial protein n=1 Tax=Serratia TaxID=613 RepID=UPI0011C869B3|nr:MULTISPECIES: fimbrial protein [Serratia]MDI6934919.1 fimbrial protein [Serratia sp. Se-PFBMAAmG]MBH2763576.1 type 1 fimbrial protein [Serratia marcescens]MBH2799162.1 type 1 fimbrial protein [Serratia marcescens]MBH2923865.1 type 1 fimbrial protein [Serratia marcescens]MBH3029839.1 type 1 fimbrial protein [Serratia marcescens]